MRRLTALALVACSGPARTPEPVRQPPPPVTSQTPAGEAPPIPTIHAVRDVREAPHGGVIQSLAMSPDGSTVLSADELGGVRLWPALDGKVEPRIVEMPAAKQLAVGKRDGGYMAVARDEAGGLYIAKLDGSARQVAHTTIAADPAIAGMVMTWRGLLAWRTDQTLVVLDADGATTEKLPTESGQRLLSVAVNGKRAIALMRREGVPNQLRWLMLEPKLAWGPWLELEQELAGDADLALSPNGKHVAALQRTEKLGTVGAVFELAKGKAIANGAINTRTADIGFSDDKHVVLGGFEGLSWIDLTVANGKPSAIAPVSPGARTEAALATGNGIAVSATNGGLVLATPTATSYLGYETVSPRIAEVGPEGQLLVGVGDHILLLDKNLRVVSTPFTALKGTLAELRWLGEDDWLLESTSPTDASMQIAIVDATGKSKPVRSGIKEVQILEYEPSTQLVTLSFGAASEVARFDRKHGSLVEVAKVSRPSPYEHVMFVPVAPNLAGGTQLVQITMKERSTIKWLRDPKALDKPAATATVNGPFAGADAAGHVFMWRNTPDSRLELVLYADGKPLRTLPNTGAVALWPEPTGERYIEVAQSSVALYSIEGKQLWFQQLATSQEALWLTDGAIAITSAGGVARLDPQTGAVTAARCGWRFGIASKPHPATPRVEPLCAQLRR